MLKQPMQAVAPDAEIHGRLQVRGKFLYANNEKFYIRGVTYGTFRPDDEGNEYHDPATVERDFAQMAAHGLNAVRTYTVPPRWLLDTALRYGLRVMVGLPWEQHIAFLDNRKRTRDIEQRVREGVRTCAGHPAVLCYAIGNEIPAPIVRWYGARKVERFLKALYLAAKAEDPEGLVTYVNYPSTEYLQLPFVDFVCFNVYLESQDRLEAYLARLQNLAGDRPLVMAEIGLDSRRNGTDGQAASLDWQIRAAFGSGCAGLFVFAWTDEWHRGGYDIDDWDFGLTDRERNPKPALRSVSDAYSDVPFPQSPHWPRISVVVCSHNGARTIADCCEGLQELQYPNFEAIIVDDGSTDGTALIARRFGFRVISTENRGLSSARNTGLEAATGEIVAYIDDDARPDPHWLTYLAGTFMRSEYVGVGGPNVPPPGDGQIAECVANAPGGPVHVLLSDRQAEHIPGCNMAFRKEALLAIGGFDPRYRAAGDDVDICWRLQEQGWAIGFSPAAMVWHHRRNSVRTYWKQQRGYGRAEALLEQKWPEKYNRVGHLSWSGRLYGRGLTLTLGSRQRIYHGVWGIAPFQSIYQPAPSLLSSLPLMPEWYLVVSILAGLTALGAIWRPLQFLLPLLVLAVSAPILQALLSASRASFTSPPASRRADLKLRSLTAVLHLLQPLARLWGRLRSGLTPWRHRGHTAHVVPVPKNPAVWSEVWQPPDEWLSSVEQMLRAESAIVDRGGNYDPWELQIRGGLFGSSRIRMAIEEHGGGKQLIRFRVWPHLSRAGFAAGALLAALSIRASVEDAWPAAALLCIGALIVCFKAVRECGSAMYSMMRAVETIGRFAITQRR